MAKISKIAVDKALRDEIFLCIMNGECDDFVKVNDRQYGCILTDLNGEQRQEAKAEKAKAKEKKIAKDKVRREAEAKAKEENANA